VSDRRRMTGIMNLAAAVVAGVAEFLAGAPAALANGIPEAWGLGMQDPASPVQAHINDYHNLLLVVITIISLFVLGLLIWVVVRYNRWVNPHASRTAHNTKLEVVWTLVPCFILIALGCISFPLLYYTDRIPPPDLTLKVTGHQWYWSYEYPDQGGISFDSHAIWDSSDVTWDQANKLVDEASQNWIIKNRPMRLLEVDNRLVLPVGEVVRVDVTGGDVEHSWFMPSLGVNRMAVPGRNSELWFKITKEGIYYGQCSMICGQGHGYMPIVIEGVSKEQFAEWVQSKQPKKSSARTTTVPNFASADIGNKQ